MIRADWEPRVLAGELAGVIWSGDRGKKEGGSSGEKLPENIMPPHFPAFLSISPLPTIPPQILPVKSTNFKFFSHTSSSMVVCREEKRDVHVQKISG